MKPVALTRTLGPVRATGLGVGSMLGAGLFVAMGPAAATAGAAVVTAVLLAAAVAALNATASARLARLHPSAGGTYVFARERLGPAWGHLAGWVFVVGKTASCAAMALAVGAHLVPDHATAVAALVVVLLTAVDLAGARRSADVVSIGAVLVLGVVGTCVVLLARSAPAADAAPPSTTGGVLTAAGLLFFAFAGYARLATLGEEVRDPRRTIPAAVAVSFVVVTALYAAVAAAVSRVLSQDVLARSDRALADAVDVALGAGPAAVVAATAVVAAGGALLSLLSGVSRTTLAMGRDRRLPAPLASVSTRGVPWVAQLAVAVAVLMSLPLVDTVDAVAASSGCVLVYYALTGAAAATVGPTWLRALALLGLVGCLVLVAALPTSAVAWTAGVVVAGSVVGRLTAARTP